MKNLWIIVSLFVASPVSAQQQTQEYTVKVTSQELDLIGRALGTQPFSEVAPLIQKLRQQVVEQQQVKPVEPPKEPPKEAPKP